MALLRAEYGSDKNILLTQVAMLRFKKVSTSGKADGDAHSGWPYSA